MTSLSLDWKLITDQVMGGVSAGLVALSGSHDGHPVHCLTGNVSLEDNGGFVQMAADLAPPPPTSRGIRLTVRGNGESYNIHLRTTALDRPWQSFRTSFAATPEWATLEFPFAGFEPHRTTARLEPGGIRRIGIVAIGREFAAEVCVAEAAWY